MSYPLPVPVIEDSVPIAHKLCRSVDGSFHLRLKEGVHVVDKEGVYLHRAAESRGSF